MKIIQLAGQSLWLRFEIKRDFKAFPFKQVSSFIGMSLKRINGICSSLRGKGVMDGVLACYAAGRG